MRAGLACVLCVSAVTLVSCVRKTARRAEHVPPTGTLVEVSTALIAAGVTDTIDMGLLRSGETVSRQLRVRNTDTLPLVITGVQTVCGCTLVEYPSVPVRPGEQATVTLELDTRGLRGWICKYVGLKTTLFPEGRKLVVTADVR